MLVTVTLNAAVDRTYLVERFELDRVHRPERARVCAGGKGINVARVYRTLGGEALATGFLGGETGRHLTRALAAEGLPSRMTRTQGESRQCIAILDPVAGTQTELNEAGPGVRSQEFVAFCRSFRRILRDRSTRAVALCGSLPPGVPLEAYRTLTEAAQSAGARVVLDASGEPLRSAIGSRPWMLKPNRFEAETLLGPLPCSPSELASRARSLIEGRTEIVAITLGAEGAFCVTGTGAWRAIPPRIDFVSAVGSGDAFVAAFLRSWEIQPDPAGALRRGVAAGAANAETFGAGFCSAEKIGELAERTEVVAVS